jgi:hypothetical protein
VSVTPKQAIVAVTIANLLEALAMTGAFAVPIYQAVRDHVACQATIVIEVAMAATLMVPVPWILVAADAWLLRAMSRGTGLKRAAGLRVGAAFVAFAGIGLLGAGLLLVTALVFFFAGFRMSFGDPGDFLLKGAAPAVGVLVLALATELVALRSANRSLEQAP